MVTCLPGNLFLVDGGLTLVLVPSDLGILVDEGILVGDGNDAGRVGNLLATDAERVTGNPKERSLCVDGWVEVGIALGLLGIGRNVVRARGIPAQSSVVGVLIRAEELGQEVGLLLSGRRRGLSKTLLSLSGVNCTDTAVDVANSIVHRETMAHAISVGFIAILGAVFSQKKLLLVLKVLGKVVQKRLHGAIHGHMVQDGEDEKNDHQSQGTNGNLVIARGHGKQSDQTHNHEVATNSQVLKSTSVGTTLGVNVGVRDVQQVVPVGEVEQVKANCSKAQNERSNAGIDNTYIGVRVSNLP